MECFVQLTAKPQRWLVCPVRFEPLVPFRGHSSVGVRPSRAQRHPQSKRFANTNNLLAHALLWPGTATLRQNGQLMPAEMYTPPDISSSASRPPPLKLADRKR